MESFTEAAVTLSNNKEIIEAVLHHDKPDNPALGIILNSVSDLLDAAIVYVMDDSGLVVGSSILERRRLSQGETILFVPTMKKPWQEIPAGFRQSV